MSTQNITVTVGIPSYFAEQNIGSLLKSILRQKEDNYLLKEVLVYSDGNTDKTVNEAKKVRSKKIIIFDMKERKGMASGFIYMLKKAKGDLFILLNDDVLIKDNLLISKMVNCYLGNKDIGLVSGNPQPISRRNFLIQAQISTFRAYERTRYLFNKGHNKYTCDGKILMLSRKFWKQIQFPINKSKLGNVDIYLYMWNKKLGFEYRHVKKAKVYFDFPETRQEFTSWSARNNSNIYLLKEQFGDLVKQEYKLPKSVHMKSMVIEFFKNPFGSTFLFLIGLYSKHMSKHVSRNFSPTWDVIASTKRKL